MFFMSLDYKHNKYSAEQATKIELDTTLVYK